MAYERPNYTQVPNALLDEGMRDMGDAELRVVLVVTRKTIGYHKESDPISWTQIMEMSGLSKSGTQDGIDQATKHNHIECMGYGQRGVGIYRLVIHSDQSDQPLVLNSDQITAETGSPTLPTKEMDTKKVSTGSARKDLLRQLQTFQPVVPEKEKPVALAANSNLVEYVASVFEKGFTVDKATANALTCHTTIQAQGGDWKYDSPIEMFDTAPAFKEFVKVRCNSLKAVPNMTPLNALKNICKISFDPGAIPGNEKKMPGYHIWLKSNQAAVELKETEAVDLGVPYESDLE